jgi:hypothetical protein
VNAEAVMLFIILKMTPCPGQKFRFVHSVVVDDNNVYFMQQKMYFKNKFSALNVIMIKA